jgi:heme-degrading monooxygenase HmoA
MALEHYASGNWLVYEGKEEEFVTRWKDWIGESTESVPGFGSARLIRSVASPRNFLSFSDWKSAESRDTWKASPEFARGMAACRELCEDFQGGDFTGVVSF